MNLKFEKNNYEYIPQLKRLWMDTFDEKEQAVDLFFERCKTFVSFYTASVDRKPVSMVFLVHSTLNGKKAHYLCSAATSKEYRKRGIMSSLIEYALEDACGKGDCYSLLFPADDGLYGYYERFGYLPNCTACKTVFSRQELEKIVENKISSQDDLRAFSFEELQQSLFENNFLMQNNEFVSFAFEYYSLYDCKAIKSENCCTLISEQSYCADVFYSLYSSFSTLAKMILENSNAKTFVFTQKAECKNTDLSTQKNSGIKNIEKYGMIKSLCDKNKTPEDVFIGITLN